MANALQLIEKEKIERTGRLDLGNCGLTELPDELFELTWLEELNLEFNVNLSDLGLLKDLVNLQVLNIKGTQVSDLNPLNALSNLKSLHATDTKIQSISPLRDLVNLEYFRVNSTIISDLSPITNWKNLQWLGINCTEVNNFNPLKGLINLQNLEIEGTQIRDLSLLKGLSNLQVVNLNNAKVSDLSPLKDLVNLNFVWVTGNPIQNVPKEIYNRGNCAQNLLAYFKELETAQKTLNNQLKIMFLGNGCVGKTTLLHWFLNKEFTPISLEEGRTHGIFIKPFAFPDSDVLAHFWDFGGQEVFHATHRLFLGRAVCIFWSGQPSRLSRMTTFSIPLSIGSI